MGDRLFGDSQEQATKSTKGDLSRWIAWSPLTPIIYPSVLTYVCINYVPIQKHGDVFDKKPDEKTYLEREIATRLAVWSYTKANMNVLQVLS